MFRYMRNRGTLLCLDPVRSTTSDTSSPTSTPSKLKQAKKLSAQYNLLCMVITMCMITIVSRVILVGCDIYYLFNEVGNMALIFWACINVMQVLAPASLFFIFYNFNCIFRDEFHGLVKRVRRRLLSLVCVCCKK